MDAGLLPRAGAITRM